VRGEILKFFWGGVDVLPRDVWDGAGECFAGLGHKRGF
jgi:hypothetical protein